ncbi:MAG TPA: N-acetyltransferase [bacterium]|nr:N-acetyltransferase [bacterium]
MTIEDLSEDKLDDFFELFQKVTKEEFPEYSSAVQNFFLGRDYSKRSFEFHLTRKFRKVLIALDGKNIIGYLVGDQTYGGVGFISFIGVPKKKRGKGIGSELVEEYEKFCKSKKAHMVRLYTFERIEPFYIKLGFERIGEEKEGYWGTRNLVMGKSIGTWNEETLTIGG